MSLDANIVGQRVRINPICVGPITWFGAAGGIMTFQVKLDRWDGVCPFVTMALDLPTTEDDPCTRH